MSGLNSGFLGTFLIILALILVGTVFFVSRSRRGVRQASSRLVELPFSDSMVTMREDAVILVQIGGSVWHMNDLAREWFGYKGNEPNLERLARRTKPSEVFLGLCVTPGQARFSLGGRLVEGSSYYIPSPSGTAGSMVVALRRLQLAEKRGSESNIAPEILIDLSQTMNSAVEFEQTIIAILDSIGRLIPSDFSQLIVLEKDNDNRTPYRLVSSPDSHNRLERLDQDISNQGYVDYLIYTKKPLLIPDIDAYQKIHPELNRIPHPINSYLGTPLLMGDELLGTLELASIAHDAFREDDLDLLSLLSGQAAIALQHTLLYQEMQKRVRGTGRVSQANPSFGSTSKFTGILCPPD